MGKKQTNKQIWGGCSMWTGHKFSLRIFMMRHCTLSSIFLTPISPQTEKQFANQLLGHKMSHTLMIFWHSYLHTWLLVGWLQVDWLQEVISSICRKKREVLPHFAPDASHLSLSLSLNRMTLSTLLFCVQNENFIFSLLGHINWCLALRWSYWVIGF